VRNIAQLVGERRREWLVLQFHSNRIRQQPNPFPVVAKQFGDSPKLELQ
jgi:hypothetical protein